VAGRERLKVRRPFRFAAVVAVVIALHAVSLRWLAQALEGPPHMKLMVNPMFTRLLKPQAPPVVVQNEPAAPPARKRRAITAVAAPVAAPPAAAASSASAAEPAASAPEKVASAPSPAASAAVAAASAPDTPSAPAIVIAADTWPADTRLSYRLTGWYDGDLTGTARVQWLRHGEHYETRVDLDLGLFGMQFVSQGDVAGDTLAPRAYEESRPGRRRVVKFGAEDLTLNDGRKVLKPPGAQDTASHFVELSHRFSVGKEPLVVGGRTSVWLARPGGVDLWVYDIVAVDRLATPRLGTVDAYHLKPRPVADARGDIYSEIWIAPTLQYLPVRIRITQGAQRFVDIMVDRIEQR
jgi:hypothetical protein